jgi:hypothetical protein
MQILSTQFMRKYQKSRKLSKKEVKKMTQETSKDIIRTGYDTQKKEVEAVEKYIKEKENELEKLKSASEYAEKQGGEIYNDTKKDLENKRISLETIIGNQKFRLLKMKETLLSIAKTMNGGE